MEAFSRELCITRVQVKARGLKIIQEPPHPRSESGVQYEDASEENCLEFKLPLFAAALSTSSLHFISILLDLYISSFARSQWTFIMISFPSSIENFRDIFVFNQRHLCLKNSNLKSKLLWVL